MISTACRTLCQPSHSPWMRFVSLLMYHVREGWETNRIQGECDGWQSVRQAVEIILNVERFRWQIYSPYSGMQWDGLIGQDPGYVASELQRRITDALLMDDRVRGISDFAYTVEGNTLRASLTVNTVYGDTQTSVEVNIT